MATRGKRPNLVLYAGLGIAAVVAVILAVSLLGGDDGDDNADTSEEPLVFGTVTVEGDSLPAFPGPENDPAVGQASPVLDSQDFDGEPATAGGGGQATMVVFLAHWCPHCQAELPVLVDLDDAGELPDGLRQVAVITGTNPAAPNYPPQDWLAREGWGGDVLLDDQGGTAASAYGLTSYPFIVYLDEEGDVVARTAGESPAETIVANAEAAAG